LLTNANYNAIKDEKNQAFAVFLKNKLNPSPKTVDYFTKKPIIDIKK